MLGELPSISFPFKEILPEDLLSSPAIIERSVDLPHPLGPIIEINSPSFTSKLTSFKAKISPSLL